MINIQGQKMEKTTMRRDSENYGNKGVELNCERE